MRDALLIGLAVFIAVAGAVITALPIVAWYGRRKAAEALYDEFMEASIGEIAFRYRRSTPPFGKGFVDCYAGQVGDLSFRLTIEIVPFRETRAYRLRLEKRVGGRELVFERSSEDDPPRGTDPIAIVARTFRRVHAEREGSGILEAN